MHQTCHVHCHILLEDSVASHTPLSHSLSHTAGRFSCQPHSTVTLTVTCCWKIKLPATLHCHTHCHMLLDDSVASQTPLSHSLSHTAGRFSCQPNSTVTFTVTYCWNIQLPATLHCHTHCHMLLDDSVASHTPLSHSLSHTAGRFSCQPHSTVTLTVTYCWKIQLPATLHCHTHCHILLEDSVASHTPLSHSLSHTAGRLSCQPHSTVTLTVTCCWTIQLPAKLQQVSSTAAH